MFALLESYCKVQKKTRCSDPLSRASALTDIIDNRTAPSDESGAKYDLSFSVNLAPLVFIGMLNQLVARKRTNNAFSPFG